MHLYRSRVGLFLAATQLALQAATPVPVDASSFHCLTDMKPVRGFFVDNLLGKTNATLAAARSKSGKAYPNMSITLFCI